VQKSAQELEKKGDSSEHVETFEGESSRAEGGTPPGILYEYQNKGVGKFAIRNRMKRKGGFFLG
jgi:hypothetical protein